MEDINEQIKALQAELTANPEDIFVKISLASALERTGRLEAAKILYREIVDRNREGVLGASAKCALQAMEESSQQQTLETEASSLPVKTKDTGSSIKRASYRSLINLSKLGALSLKSTANFKTSKSWWRWFENLSIANKQLFAFLLIEVMALALVGTGTLLLKYGLRSQLLEQSRAELEVMQMSYDSKVDEMKFGYRENAENPSIIKAFQQNKNFNVDLFNSLFLDEILLNKLELVILVDAKTNVIANTGIELKDRQFNPHDLISIAIANAVQISSSELISYDELAKANPRFAESNARDLGVDPASKPNFLMRYTITPVETSDKDIVGAIVSGDVVKNMVVTKVNDTLNHGYSAVYLIEADGNFRLATAQEKLDPEEVSDRETVLNNVQLSDTSLLKEAIAAGNKTVSQLTNVGKTGYAMSAKTLLNFKGQPIAVLVRGTCVNELDILLFHNLLIQGILLVFASAIAFFLASFLTKAIIVPIHQLRDSTLKFADGDREVRAKVFTNDEIGELTIAFNAMADSISAVELDREEQDRQRQAEVEAQRLEKERIQNSVSKLLAEIIETQQGNLTIQAQIEEGEIGSIADAFNLSIENLRTIVTQVQQATDRVQNSAHNNEASVQRLSNLSEIQVKAIAETLYSVREMGQSIYLVADTATEAAKIARDALEATQTGQKMMSHTVNSITQIRTSVAETSKKMKRLGESSQEISKIVNIIAGISEKTNILAFNASIEASRAGEHGHGFRVVADEVRRLAERVTESAQDIEKLVSAIQTDTSEAMHTMETSTNQVVVGTKLVSKTKQTLQKLAQLSQQIDSLLQSISTNTVSQTGYAQTVMQTMENVVGMANSTSTESQTVFNSLQELVEVANELQNSVSQFQIEGERG
jgi:twitching motility protein PilJ